MLRKLSLASLVQKYKYFSKHGLDGFAKIYGDEIERRSQEMRDAEHEYYRIMSKYDMKNPKRKKSRK